jgi:hypothetical protein
MKTIESVISDLQQIIDQNLTQYAIPYRRGNTIRIENVVIRASKKHGYVVFDTRTNKPITNTFSKTGAVAVAQAFLKNQSYATLKEYDTTLEKHFNDAYFYSHILDGNSDESRKDAIQIRLAESKHQIDHTKELLDDYVLKDIR